jgi:biotin-(acetyl-CoA carboxylase) ligase
MWNKKVRVKVLNKELLGQAVGIDNNGCLLLKKSNGFIELISAGDVLTSNVNHA